MTRRLMAAALVLAAAPFGARAADNEPNPYKNVKVGDFATYKVSTKYNGIAIPASITQTVTAKNDKEATIKVSFSLGGMQVATDTQTVDLTKPYDPTSVIGLPSVSDATVKKLKDGKDKVTVAGKEYSASWTTYEVKAKSMGTAITLNPVKVWMSPDVSMGIVKMEAMGDVGGQKMEITMELAETGTKKQ